MSGRGLACIHNTWREGSTIYAQAVPGSNTLNLEPVAAGAFSLLFDLHILSFHPWIPITPATSWLFTLSRLLPHTPFIILGQIFLVLTGEFFSSLTTPGPPVALDFDVPVRR